MFFKCTLDGCDKMFNCKKALKEHERTHNQDRPFKCELCDQTFTQYSSLQKHARVHDKKKPYQCDYPGCNQAFSQVSNLIRHQRIHSGDKPYQCEYCGKKFASGSNLKQHLQIHDKQDTRNQFNCIFPGCDKKYLYPSSLKKHYTVSHKEEYEKYLEDKQIETCGFHLKEDQSSSNEFKLNNNTIKEIHPESQAFSQLENEEQQTYESKFKNQKKLADFVPNPDNEATINQEGFKLAAKKEINVEKATLLIKRPSSTTPQVDQFQQSSKRFKRSEILTNNLHQTEQPGALLKNEQQQNGQNIFVNYQIYLPPQSAYPNNDINMAHLLRGKTNPNGQPFQEGQSKDLGHFPNICQYLTQIGDQNKYDQNGRHSNGEYSAYLQQQFTHSKIPNIDIKQEKLDLVDSISDYLGTGGIQNSLQQVNSPLHRTGSFFGCYQKGPLSVDSSNSTNFIKKVVPVRAIVKNPSQFKNAAITLEQLLHKGANYQNSVQKRPSSLFKFPINGLKDNLSDGKKPGPNTLNGIMPQVEEAQVGRTEFSLESIARKGITSDIEDINAEAVAKPSLIKSQLSEDQLHEFLKTGMNPTGSVNGNQNQKSAFTAVISRRESSVSSQAGDQLLNQLPYQNARHQLFNPLESSSKRSQFYYQIVGTDNQSTNQQKQNKQEQEQHNNKETNVEQKINASSDVKNDNEKSYQTETESENIIRTSQKSKSLKNLVQKK